ncbi:MAG: hypothetical protein HY840_05195 [Bacteroidetes bacterium]|nr:hypothetical protein [Bacteroidota bacterium]
MAHKLIFRKARTLAVKKQTSKKGIDKERDSQRKALKPGLRISKYGTIYTETRANRSDVDPSKKL